MKQINEKQLYFLKGYLRGFAIMNSFCNDGKTYQIEFLEKINFNIQDTLRKFYNVKNWLITSELIQNDWKKHLCDDLRYYFGQIVVEVFKETNPNEIYDEDGSYRKTANAKIENIRSNINFNVDGVVGEFVLELEKLVGGNSQMRKINIDWHPQNAEYEGFFECYSSDYIFEFEENYLYLHFGGSD